MQSVGPALTCVSVALSYFSFSLFFSFSLDPIPKSFIATMLTQVHCSSPAPIGSDTDARIDGCLMIDVPDEGQKQLYDYVRSLLESSHDAYWSEREQRATEEDGATLGGRGRSGNHWLALRFGPHPLCSVCPCLSRRY